MVFTSSKVLPRLDSNMIKRCFPWALLVLVGYVGCAAPGKPGAVTTVPVYYATTRAVAANPATPEKGFAAASAEPQPVRYGRALVQVTTAGLHIVSYDPPLAGNTGLLPGQFYRELRSQISSAHPLIVYIHGYNNTFASAADRAALFAHELQPDAAARPAIYSWPSASKL